MLNIHDKNVTSQSIADFGANRVLGMDGSLMGYIQTGNPYDRRYFNEDKKDYFVKSKNNKKSKNKLKNSRIGKADKSKLIALITVAACALASCFLLYKKGVVKTLSFPKIKETLTKTFVSKPKELFGKISSKIAKNSAAENISKSSQIDKFNKRLKKTNLEYIKKRAENATTKAAKNALNEQSQVIENAISNI